MSTYRVNINVEEQIVIDLAGVGPQGASGPPGQAGERGADGTGVIRFEDESDILRVLQSITFDDAGT